MIIMHRNAKKSKTACILFTCCVIFLASINKNLCSSTAFAFSSIPSCRHIVDISNLSTGPTLSSRSYLHGKGELFEENMPRKKFNIFQKTCRKRKVLQATPNPIEITTLDELDRAFSNTSITGDAILKSIVVKGYTQQVGSPELPDFVHPVVQLLHERRRSRAGATRYSKDGFKVALSIEGGGMRGCVSAGMAAAIFHLGLQDCFDAVYGSSAGSLIGAYFITRQLPWFGPEIYYDVLTSAGKKFIDTKRLMRALGLGLLDPRLLKDVITRPDHGKPVLDLSFLLKQTVQQTKLLNWTKFVEMQEIQPLKVIASGLKSEKAMIFDMEKKSFNTLDELASCMHASMLLPGIAGPVMNIGRSDERVEHIVRNIGNAELGNDFEPLADSLIYEPLPYRSALAEGATHVVVLRTRPDGIDVTGKPGIFDRLLMRRFFLRKNKLPGIYSRMRRQEHKKVYAEDVIVLNEAATSERNYRDTSSPHLLPIALPPGSPEITRLETDRKTILEGVRRGFARAYDALVEDPKERGRGVIVAKECFPDVILNYDPLKIVSPGTSAFENFVRERSPDDAEEIISKAKGQQPSVAV